jgi:hypothetical protein
MRHPQEVLHLLGHPQPPHSDLKARLDATNALISLWENSLLCFLLLFWIQRSENNPE